MTIDRRRFLLAAPAAIILGSAEAYTADSSVPQLKLLAERSGRIFGTTVYARFRNGPAGSFEDARYLSLVKQQCSIIVPGNELKWNRIQREAGPPNFAPADRIMSWAQKNDMPARGHTLLWQHPVRTPVWLQRLDYGSRPATLASQILATHIRSVVDRYRSQIHSYDVVNEAVDPQTGDLRTTALSEAMGGTQATVDLAFRLTHEADPTAELVYNDYMSWEIGSTKHRSGVLRLLEGFRKRDIPVHALGCQSHLFAGRTGMADGKAVADIREWKAFIDEVVAMGYKILITEMDVNDQYLPASAATRDTVTADVAGAYLDFMLSYPEVTTVIAWDLVDRYSWMQTTLPRKDRKLLRPCPFDNAYQPKLMFKSIARSFEAAPSASR